MINTENLHKLSTKEDPYYLHKIFGAICFLNFAYQSFYVVLYHKSHIDNPVGCVLMGCHALLPISSLIFHIPAVRNRTGPMIYPEFRLHSIIFSLRSVVCFYLSYYQLNDFYKMLACFLTMMSADIASYTTNDDSEKTLIRTMPFDKDTPLELQQQQRIKYFQSSMQVGATLYMLGNTHTAFLTLYGIQLPAFLMTLVRKNIIKPNTWHQWYSILLIFNIYGYYTVPISHILKHILLFNLFIELRFVNRINKYYAWTFIFLLFSILSQLSTMCHIDSLLNDIEIYLKHGFVLYFVCITRKYIL